MTEPMNSITETNHESTSFQSLIDSKEGSLDTLDEFSSDAGGNFIVKVPEWKKLKHILQDMGVSVPANLKHNTSRLKSSNIDGNKSLHETNGGRIKGISNIISMTIPHGFQLVKTLSQTGHPTLQQILYFSPTQIDSFALQDAHFVQIYRGHHKIASLPINDEKIKSSVTGLSRWIYIKKWNVSIIATRNLELRILDPRFEILSSISSISPVLSMEFNHHHDELIVGGIGNIRIWSFQKKADTQIYEFSTPRIIIELDVDQWITHTYFDHTYKILYAAVDIDIIVFDYKTGRRIESIREAHELSISAMCFYEPSQYLITGSKDGTVKIWTSQYHLLNVLREQSMSPITGVMIPPSETSPFPYIIASSLDGIIRMWNIDSGQCTYRLEISGDCLGIGFMKRDLFYHFSSDRTCIWNINRFYTNFTRLSSNAQKIVRVNSTILPSKILTSVEDGSLRIISPVSGTILSTAFPNIKDTSVKDVEYDIDAGMIWTLCNSGEVTVYSTKTNPCKILDEWKHIAGKERALCMTSVRSEYVSKNGDIKNVIALLGGTDCGQIVLMKCYSSVNRQEILVQAHPAAIKAIKCYSSGKILTLAIDGIIKVWRYALNDQDLLVSDKTFSTVSENSPISIMPFSTVASNSILSLTVHIDSFSFNERKSTLAASTVSGALVMYKLTNDGFREEIKGHSIDENHSKGISSIASLDSLGIFATSSSDGTVKVWDVLDNTLIREIQFNEPISCTAFNNIRGDLLVSLSDQIVIVKVQDYLPNHLLAELFSLPQCWVDDTIETATDFDAGVDFWELYRNNLLEEGVDISSWHVADFKKRNSKEDEIEKQIEALALKFKAAEYAKISANKAAKRLLSNMKRKERPLDSMWDYAMRHLKSLRDDLIVKEENQLIESGFKADSIDWEEADAELENVLANLVAENENIIDEILNPVNDSIELKDLANEKQESENENEIDLDLVDTDEILPQTETNFDRYRRKTIDSEKRLLEFISIKFKNGLNKEIIPRMTKSDGKKNRGNFSVKTADENASSKNYKVISENFPDDNIATPDQTPINENIRTKEKVSFRSYQVPNDENNYSIVREDDPNVLEEAEEADIVRRVEINVPTLKNVSNDPKTTIIPQFVTYHEYAASKYGKTVMLDRPRTSSGNKVLRDKLERMKELAAPMKKTFPSRPGFRERLKSVGIALPNSVIKSEIELPGDDLLLPNAMLSRRMKPVNDTPNTDEIEATDQLSDLKETEPKSFALPEHLKSRRRKASDMGNVPYVPKILPGHSINDLGKTDDFVDLESDSIDSIEAIEDPLPSNERDENIVAIPSTEDKNALKDTLIERKAISPPKDIIDKIVASPSSSYSPTKKTDSDLNGQTPKDDDNKVRSEPKISPMYEASKSRQNDTDNMPGEKFTPKGNGKPPVFDSVTESKNISINQPSKSLTKSIDPPNKFLDISMPKKTSKVEEVSPSKPKRQTVLNTVEKQEKSPQLSKPIKTEKHEDIKIKDKLPTPKNESMRRQSLLPKSNEELNQIEAVVEEKPISHTLTTNSVHNNGHRDSKYRNSYTFGAHRQIKKEKYSIVDEVHDDPEYAYQQLLAKDVDIKSKLSTLIKLYWFPSLGSNDVTIRNIIDVILRLIRHGFWKEKIEASKAAVYIYKAFEGDIPNPIHDIIIPQLEALNDENPEFRIQMCQNLSDYGVYHPDIIFALISKLKDPLESVRRAARNALATFGISSKESLRNELMKLNLIPHVFKPAHSNWLDTILAKMHRRLAQQIEETNAVVRKWRNSLDPQLYGQEFTRQPSILITTFAPDTERARSPLNLPPLLFKSSPKQQL